MDSFVARIGLGCGRLRDGIEESNSRRLLDAALDCGIRYFDTAPSYGSERILGRGLRGLRNEVQLCTKVGLPGSTRKSAAATLRALALTTIRTVLPDAALGRLKRARRAPMRPIVKERKYGNFDVTLMRSSVQQSLEQLETERLDCLMLHEPSMSDPTLEVEGLLRDWVRQGITLRLGVGTGYELEHLPDFGDVAQFAFGPAFVPGGGSRILIGHGLLRGLDPALFERAILEAGILDAMPALGRYVSDPLEISALLLNTVLAGTDIGRILVSTTSPVRLQKFIAAAKSIFGEIRARYDEDVRIKFADAARLYFSVKGVGWGTPDGEHAKRRKS
jgi:hypothetical protein